MYNSPDGLQGTASELVSDAPTYCLQAPMNLELKKGEGRDPRQSEMIGGVKKAHPGGLEDTRQRLRGQPYLKDQGRGSEMTFERRSAEAAHSPELRLSKVN
ncbi:hypothetical protein TNCV_2679851 [Trichonephila clavipes]|nr:hypothetical protein TNCV_2679851 [Trichonephila clavipes]